MQAKVIRAIISHGSGSKLIACRDREGNSASLTPPKYDTVDKMHQAGRRAWLEGESISLIISVVTLH